MAVEPQSVARPTESVLVRVLGEEVVLLDLKTEHYFTLDPVGTRMWYALVEEPDVAQATARLLEEYDVEPRQLEADLVALAHELEGRGLLELRLSDPAGP